MRRRREALKQWRRAAKVAVMGRRSSLRRTWSSLRSGVDDGLRARAGDEDARTARRASGAAGEHGGAVVRVSDLSATGDDTARSSMHGHDVAVGALGGSQAAVVVVESADGLESDRADADEGDARRLLGGAGSTVSAAEPRETIPAATRRDANRYLVRQVARHLATDGASVDEEAGDDVSRVSNRCTCVSPSGADVSDARGDHGDSRASAEIAAYATWNEQNERRPLRVVDPQVEVWDLAMTRAEALDRMALSDADPVADEARVLVGGVVARETVTLETVPHRQDGTVSVSVAGPPSARPPSPTPRAPFALRVAAGSTRLLIGASGTVARVDSRRAAIELIASAVRADAAFPRPSKVRPAVVVGTSWRHTPVEAAGKSLVLANAAAQRVEAWRTPVEARVLHGVAESARSRRIVERSLLGELQESLRQRAQLPCRAPFARAVDRTVAIRMIAAQRRAERAAESSSAFPGAVL